MNASRTWKDVLCKERFAPGSKVPTPSDNPAAPTSDLINDVNQIVSCSAFRRLQGKAQVYISPETDYVRSRLTHTLEVSGVGRLLSSIIFESMDSGVAENPKSKFENKGFMAALRDEDKIFFRKTELIESIAAACHMHDIGNPPFGHIGEYAIASWFKDNLKATNEGTSPGLHDIHSSTLAIGDFRNFDGNPQGFRLMTRIQGWKNNGGLQLTYTTLASSIKYPWGSSIADKQKPSKYGFFESERIHFDTVFSKLKLKYEKDGLLHYDRHPFSYIVEASDDIAYLTSDIEDGFKMGLIPYKRAEKCLFAIGEERLGVENQRWDWLKKEGKDSDKIKYLKAVAVLSLIHSVAKLFGEEADKYLTGEANLPLVDACSLHKQASEAKICVKNLVHLSKDKAINEQGAYNLIRTMLNAYSSAIEAFILAKKESKLTLGENTKNLLANMYRIYETSDLLGAGNKHKQSLKNRINEINDFNSIEHYSSLVDFISGMTDRRAIEMARKMRGDNITTKAY